MHENETTHEKCGGFIQPFIHRNNKSTERTFMDTKDRHWKCVRSTKIIRRHKQTLQFCKYAKKYERTLQIWKNILGSSAYISTKFQKNRQKIELWNTRVAWRFNSSNKVGQRKTPKTLVHTNRETFKNFNFWIQSRREKVCILPQRSNLAATRINWAGKRPKKRKDKSLFSIETTDIEQGIKISHRSHKINCKVLTQILEKTSRRSQLQQKKAERNWNEREEEDFKEIKKW